MNNQTEQPVQTTAAPATATTARLRLWPAVVLLALLWIVRVAATTGDFAPFKFFFGLMIVPLVVFLLLIFWWLLFSRLRRSDRFLGIGTLALVTVATILAAGENFPAMAMILYALPILVTAWIGWLILTYPLGWPLRARAPGHLRGGRRGLRTTPG